MRKVGLWSSLSLGVLVTLGCSQADALPGQSVAEVAAWIQSQPTLQPSSGEMLLVRRTDSPSRRFIFEASITAPGQLTSINHRGIIRRETITLFDPVYGVSQQRLEESLDIIYGEELYQDYQQASVVYQYPTAEMLERATSQNNPLLRFVQGAVRQGNRFAYWVEIAQTPDGKPQNGRMSIFLLEDLPKLTAELQNR